MQPRRYIGLLRAAKYLWTLGFVKPKFFAIPSAFTYISAQFTTRIKLAIRAGSSPKSQKINNFGSYPAVTKVIVERMLRGELDHVTFQT